MTTFRLTTPLRSGGRAQCERNVLDLLHAGLAPREIAERLALSEATVYLVIAD